MNSLKDNVRSKKATLMASIIILLFLIILSIMFHKESGNKAGKATKTDHISAGKNDVNQGYSIHTPYEMTKDKGRRWDEIEKNTATAEQQAMMRGVIKKMNFPVDFHAIVMDQNGEPVPGVTVNCKTIRSAYLDSGAIESGAYRFVVETDAKGGFSISGFNAINLRIVNMEKDGYLASEDVLSKSIYDAISNGLSVSDSDPKVLYIWKLDAEREPLVQDMQLHLISGDGTPKIIKINKENADFGTIHIAVDSGADDYVANERRWTWSFTVGVPDGGVLLTDAPMPYLAPRDGYAPKMTLQIEARDPQWAKQKKVTAYVFSGTPRRYSRVIFNVDTRIGATTDLKEGNKAYVNCDIETNPSGSPLLLPEPRQR